MSADWHALTTEYADTSKVEENTFEMVADWLTAGIDPQKVLYLNSQKFRSTANFFNFIYGYAAWLAL